MLQIQTKMPVVRRTPDSWYSWVVALCSMLVMAATFGIFRSSGVIFVEVIHVFDVDREQATWPFAVSGICNCLSGLMSGALASFLTVRQVVILGIIVSSFGVGLCYFASSILWITICYGIIFGTGTGLCFISLPLIVNDYFVKYRTTGNGFFLAGTPIGVIMMAPLAETLIETYALRGTFVFMSAICVQGLVFAAMLKPLSEPTTNLPRKHTLKAYVQDNGSEVDQCNNNTETLNMELSTLMAAEDRNDIVTEKIQEETCATSDNGSHKEVYSCQLPVVPERELLTDSTDVNNDKLSVQDINLKVEELLNNSAEESELTSESNCKSKQITSTAQKQVQNRRHSVKLPRVLQFLRQFIRVVTNPMFALIAFNYMVVMSSVQTITIVLVDFGEDKGLSREQSVLLVTVLSVPEIFGRACSGWITDKGFLRRDVLLMCSQFTSGLLVIALSLAYNQIALCIILALFGILTSSLMVIVNVVCVDNFEKELLGLVFGLRHCCMIVTFIIRPWVIGVFRDSFGSYDYLFQAIGCVSAVSGFLWFLLMYGSKNEPNRLNV